MAIMETPGVIRQMQASARMNVTGENNYVSGEDEYGWGYPQIHAAQERAWNNWVVSSSTNCTSCDGAWNSWVIESANTYSTGTNHAWNVWTAQAVSNIGAIAASRAGANANIGYVNPRIETTEERIAREEREVKQRLAIEARQRELAAEAVKRDLEAKKASKRAKRLLTSHLTKAQAESLEKHGFFEIVVEGKTYRIRQGIYGNVRLIENGKETKSFCIQPGGIPAEDAMLAQKLLLEADEKEFLKIAKARVIITN
jgi:hypothetical protein